MSKKTYIGINLESNANLSLLAHYDDMCRTGNSLMYNEAEEELMIKMLQKYEDNRRELVSAKQQLVHLSEENQNLRTSVRQLANDCRRERWRSKSYEKRVSELRDKCQSLKTVAFYSIQGNEELAKMFDDLNVTSSGDETDNQSIDDNLNYTVDDCHQLTKICADMSLPEYMKYRKSQSQDSTCIKN